MVGFISFSLNCGSSHVQKVLGRDADILPALIPPYNIVRIFSNPCPCSSWSLLTPPPPCNNLKIKSYIRRSCHNCAHRQWVPHHCKYRVKFNHFGPLEFTFILQRKYCHILTLYLAELGINEMLSKSTSSTQLTDWTESVLFDNFFLPCAFSTQQWSLCH